MSKRKAKEQADALAAILAAPTKKLVQNPPVLKSSTSKASVGKSGVGKSGAAKSNVEQSGVEHTLASVTQATQQAPSSLMEVSSSATPDVGQDKPQLQADTFAFGSFNVASSSQSSFDTNAHSSSLGWNAEELFNTFADLDKEPESSGGLQLKSRGVSSNLVQVSNAKTADASGAGAVNVKQSSNPEPTLSEPTLNTQAIEKSAQSLKHVTVEPHNSLEQFESVKSAENSALSLKQQVQARMAKLQEEKLYAQGLEILERGVKSYADLCVLLALQDERALALLRFEDFYLQCACSDPMNGQGLYTDQDRFLQQVYQQLLTGSNLSAQHCLDRVSRIWLFVHEAVRNIMYQPHTSLLREHKDIPLYFVKEVDTSTMIWLARRSGRNIREKLQGRLNIRAVTRKMEVNTLENRLFKAFVADMQDMFDAKRKALHFEDQAFHSLSSRVLAWLHSDDALDILPWDNLEPNNLLLSDRQYHKIWMAWNWLKNLDIEIKSDYEQLEQRCLQSLFWGMAASLKVQANAVLLALPCCFSMRRLEAQAYWPNMQAATNTADKVTNRQNSLASSLTTSRLASSAANVSKFTASSVKSAANVANPVTSSFAAKSTANASTPAASSAVSKATALASTTTVTSSDLALDAAEKDGYALYRIDGLLTLSGASQPFVLTFDPQLQVLGLDCMGLDFVLLAHSIDGSITSLKLPRAQYAKWQSVKQQSKTPKQSIYQCLEEQIVQGWIDCSINYTKLPVSWTAMQVIIELWLKELGLQGLQAMSQTHKNTVQKQSKVEQPTQSLKASSTVHVKQNAAAASKSQSQTQNQTEEDTRITDATANKKAAKLSKVQVDTSSAVPSAKTQAQDKSGASVAASVVYESKSNVAGAASRAKATKTNAANAAKSNLANANKEKSKAVVTKTNVSTPANPTPRRDVSEGQTATLDLSVLQPRFKLEHVPAVATEHRLLMQVMQHADFGSIVLDVGLAEGVLLDKSAPLCSTSDIFQQNQNSLLENSHISLALYQFLAELNTKLKCQHLYYIVPDGIHEFSLLTLYRQVSHFYRGAKPLPRSIAAVLSYQYSVPGAFAGCSNAVVLVVSMLGENYVLTPVKGSHDEKMLSLFPRSNGWVWERYPSKVLEHDKLKQIVPDLFKNMKTGAQALRLFPADIGSLCSPLVLFEPEAQMYNQLDYAVGTDEVSAAMMKVLDLHTAKAVDNRVKAMARTQAYEQSALAQAHADKLATREVVVAQDNVEVIQDNIEATQESFEQLFAQSIQTSDAQHTQFHKLQSMQSMQSMQAKSDSKELGFKQNAKVQGKSAPASKSSQQEEPQNNWLMSAILEKAQGKGLFGNFKIKGQEQKKSADTKQKLSIKQELLQASAHHQNSLAEPSSDQKSDTLQHQASGTVQTNHSNLQQNAGSIQTNAGHMSVQSSGTDKSLAQSKQVVSGNVAKKQAANSIEDKANVGFKAASAINLAQKDNWRVLALDKTAVHHVEQNISNIKLNAAAAKSLLEQPWFKNMPVYVLSADCDLSRFDNRAQLSNTLLGRIDTLQVNDVLANYDKAAAQVEDMPSLWKDHLPEMYMRASQNNSICHVPLVKNSTIMPSFGKSVEINSCKFILPANKANFYHFPLTQSEGGERLRYEVEIRSEAFPLAEDVPCILNMSYTYGAENPYLLRIFPVNPETAPFREIITKWIDSKDIQRPSPVPELPEHNVASLPELLTSSSESKVSSITSIIQFFKMCQAFLRFVNYSDVECVSKGVYTNYAVFLDDSTEFSDGIFSLFDGTRDVRLKIHYEAVGEVLRKLMRNSNGITVIAAQDTKAESFSLYSSRSSVLKLFAGKWFEIYRGRSFDALLNNSGFWRRAAHDIWEEGRSMHPWRKEAANMSGMTSQMSAEFFEFYDLVSSELGDLFTYFLADANARTSMVFKELLTILACMGKDAPQEYWDYLLREHDQRWWIDPMNWIRMGLAIGRREIHEQMELWDLICQKAESGKNLDAVLKVMAINYSNNINCFLKRMTVHEAQMLIDVVMDGIAKYVDTPLQDDRACSFIFANIAELMFVLLLTRKSSDPVLADLMNANKPHTLQMADAIEQIIKECTERKLEIKTFVKFSLHKPESRKAVPDLFYAVHMYLTGDDGTSDIKVISIETGEI